MRSMYCTVCCMRSIEIESESEGCTIAGLYCASEKKWMVMSTDANYDYRRNSNQIGGKETFLHSKILTVWPQSYHFIGHERCRTHLKQ